ncbi:TPA: transglycosylase SLT domain-containing protein [Enterobacter asburiae]|nr:transglycosylase SLT domain-containing protein [Enterobacter asburiae]HCR2223653.1 transglycosylase SLT domain-containing protein [Enterobacter asburiae]
MAASVIDALVITLGLDTSGYDKGRKDVTEGMKKSRENAETTAKFMESQGKKASSFFSSIKNELLALAGVSLSAAGLTSFVKSTTSGLMNLSIQSKALGISAKQLDGWSKSAEAAGSSAEKITGTLNTFQNAIQSYRSGDASSPIFKALALLSSDTGVTFDPPKMNSDEMLRSVSQALQKERSGDRARYLAQQLGIDDATLQSIRSGQFVSNANKFTAQSGVSNSDIENAKRFNVEWTILQQKLEKVGYYIFNSLSPYIDTFTKYLMELADWVAQHPKEIKDSVMGFFNAISEVAKACDDAVQWVGGWKNAILILIGASVGGKLLSFMGLLTSSIGGLSRIALPAWLIAAAGLSASNKIDEARQSAQKEGVDVGTYLINKRKEKDKENEAAFDKAMDRLTKWWDRISGTDTSSLALSPQQQAMQSTLSDAQFPLIKAPQATGKGKALLDFMSTQFGQLEAKYGLPTGLLRSVATVESGGNPYATSGAGARGLFQFMPGTAKDLGINPLDPSQAANGAARYLRQLLNQTGGNLEDALAAYNWGIGNVQKKGRAASPLETQMYVPKVLAGLPTGAAATATGYMPMSSPSGGRTEINISGVSVSSPATKVDALTRDIMQNANNRIRLAGFESGQL